MGHIIVGFPGVGKSSFKTVGWIDLRSDCFWISFNDTKIRPESWYESFCNVAIDLASQGYNVFIPSHEILRRFLKDHNQSYIVIYPNHELKDKWIQKLYDRYQSNPNRETLSAYESVRDHWDEFMRDLNDEENSIILQDTEYCLKDLLLNYENFI